MINREKVIKAFEICYTSGNNCTVCPLFQEDDCNDKLMRDVLSLLKEQEPRVLTLDEVEKYVGYFDDIRPQDFEKLPLWTESKDGTNIFSGYRDVANIRELIQTSGLDRNYIAYKHWRCWSIKPTEEQRKAVKWDD